MLSDRKADGNCEVVPPFKLISLSATGRTQAVTDKITVEAPFCLEDEDLPDPVIQKRLAARNALKSIEIGDGKEASYLIESGECRPEDIPRLGRSIVMSRASRG